MKLSSHKRKRKKQIVLEMTSMIDVVFLLLIFFIVTASFTKTERDLNAVTKADDQSAQTQQSDLEPAVVVIKNSSNGFVYSIGSNEFTDVDQLAEILENFPNKGDGAFVRASDDAPYGMAASAIQVCKDAEFTGVSYIPLSN